MDSITRQNLFMFLGAVCVLGAFWLFVLGIGESDVLKMLGGVGSGVAAIVLFRLYAAARREAP